MTHWIAQIEVEAECVLPDDAEPIKYEDPHGQFQVRLSNRNICPLSEKPLLEMQLEFEADNLEDAHQQAKPLAREFLYWLSFVSKSHFRVSHVERILDWTPGLAMREQYVYHTDHTQMPTPLLSADLTKTIELLNTEGVPSEVKRAIRWFANGVSAELMDDQFQCFYYAIEILAEYHKSPDRVPDLCPRCRGELFCQTCDEVSKHRPYAKQAIQQLIATVVEKGPGKAFELLDTTRNHIMHGRLIDEIEDELPIPFKDIVDHAGGIAWTCIMNSIPMPLGSHHLALAETTTYVRKRLIVWVHAKVGGDAIGDPDNPQLSEKSSLNISIIRKEQEDDQSND